MTNSETYKKIVSDKVKNESYHQYATEVNIFVQEYNSVWRAIKEVVINTFFKQQ